MRYRGTVAVHISLRAAEDDYVGWSDLSVISSAQLTPDAQLGLSRKKQTPFLVRPGLAFEEGTVSI